MRSTEHNMIIVFHSKMIKARIVKYSKDEYRLITQPEAAELTYCYNTLKEAYARYEQILKGLYGTK